MQAVVMAGGAGSRLRPLTVGRPKPIVPIVNKPVIAHIRDLLIHHGIKDQIVTLQYMPDQVQDYIGDGSEQGISIRYVIEETPLGTAGSVKNAQAYLDNTFVVISGDAVTDVDITSVVKWHCERCAKVTIVLHRVKEPPEYGVVITDAQGRIQSFQEKPSWGEVMSDTVNTGIYVLDLSVLDQIPANTPYDFSKDLFPSLLAAGEPMYGYISEAYWTDVGNLGEYMQANADVLRRAVKGINLGTHIGGDIWVEGNYEIAPDAQLYGPIYLGHGVKIKGGVVIQGPTVIRQFSVVDNRAYIDRSIIWRNCYIGEMAEVRGAIICRSCNLKSRTVIYEGVVLGDGTSVGEGATIYPGVKIWPGKAVDASSSVRQSIIWGSQGRRTLFSRFGVSGLVNVDLTPEFAAKLGAAYAGTLPRGSTVAINRDISRSAQMLKRAIIAGLPSAGVDALDTKSAPIPVLRYYTSTEKNMAGSIHVRISPFDSRVVDIRFYDSEGTNLSKSNEREIERAFFREDYRRVYLDEIGIITDAPSVNERYMTGYMNALDVDAIRAAKFSLVVDCANAPTSAILPSVLTDLNCTIVALNAQLDENRMSIPREEFDRSREELRLITQTLNKNLGVRLDVGGERLFVVDDLGRQLPETTVAAALAWLALREHKGGAIVVPVNAPHVFEQIAAQGHGEVWRTRFDAAEMMRMARREEVLLAADGLGNLIFPSFHPNIDGIFAVAKLLEYLAHQDIKLSQVVDSLPPYFRADRRVDCPWELRGFIMRQLNERYGQVRDSVVEGVQITLGEREWVLMLPNPDEPFIHIYGEADSHARATIIAEEYADTIRGMFRST